ncbi:MAG: hypothetical protein IJR42_01365 [Paludibacteraceae bacterium]|nr:hypothetical protein [Paludibacteraceae bacterium]
MLSSSELSQHEISDELAQRIDGGLMSLDGAKNNRDVLNHYKPIVLKAIDDKFAVLAEKYGIADKIAAEKSSYNKLDILEQALAAKLADAEARVQSAGGQKSEEVTRLTKQISDLQGQLQTLTASKEAELKSLRDQYSKSQLDMLINFDLKGRNYANAELGDTNVDIAHAIISKALQEQKAVIVNDNGVLKLKQADNLDLDFLDGQYKPVSFSDFVSRTLADKHLLAVQGNGDDDHRTPPAPPAPTIPTGQDNRNTRQFEAALAASMADDEN